MIISLLVAMDERGAIGLDNALPWKLSSDLKRFKQLTLGHHIIMGRRTYESIGRPLPGRTNVVVSRTLASPPPGCLLARSLSDALNLAEQAGEVEAFVIGGAQLFAEALPLAGRIYLTRVHAHVPADTFFPPFDERAWMVLNEESVPAGERDEFPHTFRILSAHGADAD